MKPFLALFFFITSLCAEVMVDDYLNGPTTPTQNLRSQKGIMPKICDLNSSAALGEDIARGAMSAGIGAVSAEVIAEAYVGDRQLTEADRDFIERGVLLSQIGAIISASLLDLDVDTAATFGGIAARENTFNLKGPEVVPLTEEGITALRESLAQMQVENPALAKKVIAVQRIFNRYLSGEVSREKLAKGAVLLCVQLNDYMAKHPEGTAAMTTTLEYAGMLLNFAFKAQITLAAGPIGLAAACAVDQAVEAGVERSIEAIAKEASSLGKTAAQQERFYQAVRNVVGTGLLLVGASKMKGAVKGLKFKAPHARNPHHKTNAHAAEAEVKVGADGRIKQPNVVDASHFTKESLIKPLDKKGRVMFDGVEFRAVRDLSHMSENTLRDMVRYGKNPESTFNIRLDGHHNKQQYHREPGAFIIEIPENKHSIGNKIQHPLGNKGGLTKEQRTDWDKVRKAFNKERAKQELIRRGIYE